MINNIKICWNITNYCNDNCLFCFRDLSSKPLNFKENKKIIYDLANNGVKSITFSGGEALLHPNIVNIIKFSSSLNMETTLVTNGIKLNNDLLVNLENYLDWITLPIDSMNQIIQTKVGRNNKHLYNIKNIIQYITLNNLNYKIKINTVLSSLNKSSLNEISCYIKNTEKIKRWKILQFTPLRDISIQNKNSFEISTEEYQQIVKSLKLEKIRKDLRINFDSIKSIKKLYIIISPNGELITWDAKSNKEKIVGDLKNNSFINILHNLQLNYEEYFFRLNSNLAII